MGQSLTEARRRLEEAARFLGGGRELLEVLNYPLETLSATLPLRMDDGSLQLLKAWRCRYNDWRGPTKGGIRFHPGVTIDEVMTLAFWMTLKCALAGLPYGGGKGGVQIDSKPLSQRERETLSRAYVRGFASMIGSDKDIPAPDLYTDAQVMAWMVDEHETLLGRRDPAAFTGKPIAIGGSAGRDVATGRGAFFVLEALKDWLGLAAGKSRLAVQGYGNAGSVFAHLAEQAGWTIVAVSDSKGGVYAKDGLSCAALDKAKQDSGSVASLGKGKSIRKISNEELLVCDCELLVPAAIENQIDAKIAAKLNAGAVLEIANGPTLNEADAILRRRGIRAVPDILANAGGVIVSHMEWVQNRIGDSWTFEQVDERLSAVLTTQAHAVREQAEANDLDLRQAAYVLALQRLLEAAHARGTVGVRSH